MGVYHCKKQREEPKQQVDRGAELRDWSGCASSLVGNNQSCRRKWRLGRWNLGGNKQVQLLNSLCARRQTECTSTMCRPTWWPTLRTPRLAFLLSNVCSSPQMGSRRLPAAQRPRVATASQWWDLLRFESSSVVRTQNLRMQRERKNEVFKLPSHPRLLRLI